MAEPPTPLTSPSSPPWTGESGLIDDCWTRILGQTDVHTWWRARGACTELRDLAHTGVVMRAQLTQPGVGRLPADDVDALSEADLLAKVRLRLALDRNLAAQGVRIDIHHTPSAGANKLRWAFVLPDGELLRGTANSEVDRLCLRRPGRKRPCPPPPTPSLEMGDTGRSRAGMTLGGKFFYFATPGRFSWWETCALEVSRGVLEVPQNVGFVDFVVADDGLMGGVLACDGSLHVVGSSARRPPGRWDWRPGAHASGVPSALTLGLALPRGGSHALVLTQATCGRLALTSWRLTAADPQLEWGPKDIFLPSSQPQGTPRPFPPDSQVEFRQCLLSPDQKHLALMILAQEPGGLISSPPMLLRLDANLMPLCPSAVLEPEPERARARGDEGIPALNMVWSLSGRELWVAQGRGPKGGYICRWEMLPAPGPIARLTHAFGNGDGSPEQQAINGGGDIAYLDIAQDGVRAALARPGGRVEMWRLDGKEPRHAWTFKPGRQNYVSIDFISKDTQLLLTTEGGSVLTLDMAADLPPRITCSATPVVPEVPLRGLKEMHLDTHWVDKLRPR